MTRAGESPADSRARLRVGQGLACGLAAAAMWAVWAVATKMGVEQTLGPFDMTALRFAVSGVILAPVVWRHRGEVTNWPGAVAISCAGGAPYVLLAIGGLTYAPAGHSGVINPGLSLLAGFLGGWTLLGEGPGKAAFAGVLVVGAGLLLFSWGALAGKGHALQIRGDLMFAAAGILWGAYTVGVRRLGLGSWLSTSLVCVISLVIYLPIYLLFLPSRIPMAGAGEILAAMALQGLGAAIFGVVMFTTAVRLLGARRAALFPALVPGLAVILSFALLGERVSLVSVLGLCAVSGGLVLSLLGR